MVQNGKKPPRPGWTSDRICMWGWTSWASCFLCWFFFSGCFGQRYSVSIIKCYFMRLYHETTNHLHYKLVLLQHPLVFLLSFNDASQSSMTFNFYNFHHDSVALNLSLTCSFFLLLSLSLFFFNPDFVKNRQEILPFPYISPLGLKIWDKLWF